MRSGALLLLATSLLGALAAATAQAQPRRTVKPVLHGRHWVAITGKPLAATAGALVFAKGGNAVDAACAMLAATCTMWDTLGWGGETQALVYDPRTKKVIGINALGVAPTGATPAFFKAKGLAYPPEYGPLAAVTPGTPGGLITMLAEYGRLSLKEVLEPAILMADGYPIEAQLANALEQRSDALPVAAEHPCVQLLARRERGLDGLQFGIVQHAFTVGDETQGDGGVEACFAQTRNIETQVGGIHSSMISKSRPPLQGCQVCALLV